jgi:hypothetical protein
MKATTVAMAIMLSVGLPAALRAAGHELPMFGQLPNPGKNWSKKDGSGAIDAHTSMSWVNFENIETGDVLSFVAWRSPGIRVTHSPVRQASIETFTSDGYARLSTPVRGVPIADLIRNRFVFIDIRNHAAKMTFDEKAIEYTYIFGSAEGASFTVAHGYIAVLGDVALFVRHTSKRIITSDLARDMVFGILVQHFKTISGIDTGWSFSIDQSQDTDEKRGSPKQVDPAVGELGR